ncbi:PVC-type heme-binding CxxCH protein [Segetibacter sp.]|uniref:PVC-type heme-binding CxxCH protein n=1 Tax=Segetibacter sp. TaxID=2231182 RepID=UPI002611EEB1|nr:PVC-type heme-binding CxxCH protein [Segetibacter sp.]MCW3079749.1 repeat protein [Segetibacter sp.]
MSRYCNPVRHIIFYLLIISTVIIISWKNYETKTKGGGKEALSTFELEPGFKIELVADEPLISDPVDMEIDEYGRMYVVEMHGYPLDKAGSGKIKLVTDSDGDGRMDKSTVFADSLTLPNSILRWKKGVIVTDAPYVFYFEDTDNDGRADVRDTLLTGFALSNPQHNLNNPVYGIDNWIYLAHEGAVGTQSYKEEFGDPGSEVYYPRHPESPRLARNASGRSVRFQPDKFLLETVSSNTQFGHTFDAWGHYFLVSNANHIFQEVISASYLKRNPELVVSNATQSISDHQNAAEVFPITKNPQHQLLTDVGVITSACGITSYLGGAFPAPFNNVTFVAEPVSNLVHVDRIKENGVSFTASRSHPNKEFLASTDSWFRPVNMYVGPDGALYIVDYYRQIIEHPEWMGEEVVKSGKLYNGSDKGRIYRVTLKNAAPAAWIKGLRLGDFSTGELIQQLANPNIWWRLNAQRLLVDRLDKKGVPELIQMAGNTKSPYGRLHAMWTLEGLGELTTGVIEQALKDPIAGVRENAIKLAELHFSHSPGLQTLLLALRDDPNKKVRFQLLCTLGSVNTLEASQVRNTLLFRDLNEPWVQVAALSAGGSHSTALLKAVIDSFRNTNPAYTSLVERLSTMIATSEKPKVVRQLVQQAVARGTGNAAIWKGALLKGLSRGIKNEQLKTALKEEQGQLLNALFANSSKPVRAGVLDLFKVIGLESNATTDKAKTWAAALAGNPQQPTEKRVEAIHFIALSNPAPYASLLKDLISSSEHPSIQVAAMQTLSALAGTTVSQYLLTKWTDLTPDIRNEAINTFLTDTARITILLNALEKGTIQKSAIGWPRSVRLMAQRDFRLRDRARALLTKDESESMKVNKDYQPALSLSGNAVNGKQIFFRNCSGCHQIRGSLGVEFGPDLGTIHNWSAEAIMANILAPNLSISSGFDLWTVELKDGGSFQGVISTETPTAITLKNAGNEIRTIKRSEVKSLKSLNMSSMPGGLEKQINQQQMADLISYLKQNK